MASTCADRKPDQADPAYSATAPESGESSGTASRQQPDLQNFFGWSTPSPAGWQQIKSVATRACDALIWAANASLSSDTSKDLKLALLQLLHDLIIGYCTDTQLDFSDLLQHGFVVIMLSWKCFGSQLATLRRLTLALLRRWVINRPPLLGRKQGGLQACMEPLDCIGQVQSIANLFGKLHNVYAA